MLACCVLLLLREMRWHSRMSAFYEQVAQMR